MAKSSRGRRSGGSRAARPQTNRHYPRTARLNTLLQEIVAGYFERTEDEALGLVTVTGVEVDNDLNRAQVFVSALGQFESPEDEERYLEALAEHRKRVQGEIASQARIRKTPEVLFQFDPGVRAGARIEEILSSLPETSATEDDPSGEDPEQEA